MNQPPISPYDLDVAPAPAPRSTVDLTPRLLLAPILHAPNEPVVARSAESVEADRQARANGFAPPPETYAVDGRNLRNACANLVDIVQAEKRVDVTARAVHVTMSTSGWIEANDEPPMWIEPSAFSQLCTRLGYGGAAYLAGQCSPELRSINVHSQRARIADAERAALAIDPEAQPMSIVLRTRIANLTSESDALVSIFAVVSPGYAPFDADLVARAVSGAAPEDAIGSVTYDGMRSRFLVHLPAFVPGEAEDGSDAWQAGVIVTSSDNAGASICGQSVAIHQPTGALLMADPRGGDAFALRHVGNVYELERKFRGAFPRAIGALSPFVEAWTAACRESLRPRTQQVSSAPLPNGAEELVRGIFRGILTGAKPLVRIPGKRVDEKLIDAITALWRDGDGATGRAAVVLALVRYARGSALDPWAQDEITRQACAILWAAGRAKSPKALEYVELQVDGSEATVSA